MTSYLSYVIKKNLKSPFLWIGITLILLSGIIYLYCQSIHASISYNDARTVYLSLSKADFLKNISLLTLFCAVEIFVLIGIFQNKKINISSFIEVLLPLVIIAFILKANYSIFFHGLSDPIQVQGLLKSKNVNKGARGGIAYFISINSLKVDLEVEGDVEKNGFQQVTVGNYVRVLYNKDTRKCYFIEMIPQK